MKKKRRSKRSGRLWAAGCLTVVLCAGIIFYGYRMARAPQERESQDTAQEENAAQAGNTTNVEAQVKDNPDAKDETGNGAETGAGDTASVDGQTSADGTSGDGSGADATNAGSTGSAEADMAASAGTADGIISSTAGSGADSRAKYTGDISALDNTLQGWGQGVQFDSLNRPQGAVTAQGKYGKYSADFIRTDESDAKRIYLTFDEGYENGYTSQILDVLKEKNCPAVFFVTMPYVKQQPELIRRMIDEGHIVGNHSVTHPSGGLPSQSREQQERELLDLHDYVKENFGYEMSLFRYPAGKFSEQSLALVQSVGYTSVFWSFAYKDWDPDNQPEETAALAKLKERLHPGAIYLLHAVSSTNTHVLGQFIDDARAAGYEFVPYR